MKLNYFFSTSCPCPAKSANYNRHYFIGHLLLHSDIGFTSCQGSLSDKISRLTGKPLQIKESYQGIYSQLRCLVGSNFRNLHSLVSTLSSIKGRKLKVGLYCFLGPKRENLKNKNKRESKKRKNKNSCFSLEFTLKCSSHEISCQINFNIVVCFGVDLT